MCRCLPFGYLKVGRQSCHLLETEAAQGLEGRAWSKFSQVAFDGTSLNRSLSGSGQVTSAGTANDRWLRPLKGQPGRTFGGYLVQPSHCFGGGVVCNSFI